MPTLAQSSPLSDSALPSEPEPEPETEEETRNSLNKRQPAKPKAKTLSSKNSTAHKIIEKRYRNKLNKKIEALRDSVPSLRIAAKEKCGDGDSAEGDLGGQIETQKLNKVSVATTLKNFATQPFNGWRSMYLAEFYTH